MRNIMDALNITPDGKSNVKNGNDLTAGHTFTHKVGQLFPVDVIDTVPDSDYRISLDAYSRTMPNHTANFAHLKENYYLLFVPYGLVTRNAYQMFVDRKEKVSALDFDISQMPTFSLREAVKAAIAMSGHERTNTASDSLYFDVEGFNIGCNAIKMFSMFGYGDYTDIMMAYRTKRINYDAMIAIIDQTIPDYHPTATRLCAYQACWYHFFRNDIYDIDAQDPKSFNLDDVSYLNTQGQANWDICACRNWSYQQFIRECCQLRYHPYKKDLFTAMMPGTQYGAVSSVGLKNGIEVFTEQFNAAQVKPVDEETFGNSWAGLDATHYSNNSDSNQILFRPNGSTADGTHLVVGAVKSEGYVRSGQNLFDVLQLVESQAIQKWRQKSMLAGSRTIDQWRAHYGVVPRHLVDHRPDFIGSVDNKVEISAIINQSDTAAALDNGTSNLGDMAGRGYGASDDRFFNFHANDYGCLIILKAVVPESVYTSFGLDRANQKVFYTDFYHSEFQNIGLEVLPLSVFDTMIGGAMPVTPDVDGEGGNSMIDFATGARGYVPRNYDHKIRISKTHGLINPSRLYVGTTTSESVPEEFKNGNVPFGFADMQAFSIPRKDAMTNVVVLGTFNQDGEMTSFSRVATGEFRNQVRQLYVSPSCVDSIFNFNAGNDDTSDQIICDATVRVSQISPLTPLGLPQF